MAKDYRRDSVVPRASQKRKQNRPCLIWFLAGAGLGVVGSTLLNSRHADTPTEPEPSKTANSAEQPAPPNFTFQKILTDTRVDTRPPPPPPPSAPHPQPQPAMPAAPADDADAAALAEPPPVAQHAGTYVVQAGSFKRQADADRVKAELALLGISSSVQTGTLPNGQTAYRIRVGPYASKQAAEQAHALLKRHGKDAMVIPIH